MLFLKFDILSIHFNIKTNEAKRKLCKFEDVANWYSLNISYF